ncbi:MAG: hypothetical protein H0W73_15420 [Bacteroidetes bacterium]|nr:hypothetical protein [Bacteroidota bacterium]
MKWKNAKHDDLPLNNQEVLITVDGINYIATYDKLNKAFKLNNNPGAVFFANKKTIYWMEIVAPEEND